ncbi:MAG: hypothetical protein JWN72_593 [Thermoleophilia bacterium]|nr:hypothetical protein [Thermoleophilia bacterium]
MFDLPHHGVQVVHHVQRREPQHTKAVRSKRSIALRITHAIARTVVLLTVELDAQSVRTPEEVDLDRTMTRHAKLHVVLGVRESRPLQTIDQSRFRATTGASTPASSQLERSHEYAYTRPTSVPAQERSKPSIIHLMTEVRPIHHMGELVGREHISEVDERSLDRRDPHACDLHALVLAQLGASVEADITSYGHLARRDDFDQRRLVADSVEPCCPVPDHRASRSSQEVPGNHPAVQVESVTADGVDGSIRRVRPSSLHESCYRLPIELQLAELRTTDGVVLSGGQPHQRWHVTRAARFGVS